MIKKPSRVRVLITPYQDDGDRDPTGYGGPATVLTGLPRTIRRHELRLIVPLADSTIYENGKTWRIPPPLQSHTEMRGLGPGRGRGMAAAAPPNLSRRPSEDRARPGCSPTQDPPREVGDRLTQADATASSSAR